MLQNNTVNPSIKKRLDQSDCFVCIIKIALTFSSLSGLSAVKCSCPHQDKKSTNQTVERSNFHYVLSIIYTFMFSIIIGYLLYTFINCHKKLECYELISELMFSINAFVAIIISIKFNKLRINEFKNWIYVLESKRTYGFRTILNRKIINRVRRFALISCSLIIFVTIVFCILFYAIPSKTCTIGCYMIRAGSIWSIYVQMVIIFEITMLHVLVRALNNICLTTVIQFMCDVLSEDETLVEINDKYCRKERYMIENIPLEYKLRNFIKFRTIVYNTIEMLYKFISPSTFVWISTTLVILIINIYVLINIAIVGTYDVNILVEIKTYTVIICIIYLLNIVEETKKQVSSLFLSCHKIFLCLNSIK